MSGSPKIRGNTKSDGTTADNVYIYDESVTITVVGELEGESLVGVTLGTEDGTGTFAKPSGDPLTDLTPYKGFFFSDKALGIRPVAEDTYINLELFIGYDITVNTAEHGKIEASATYAAEGDTISISVDPDTNYELESLSVTDGNGDPVEYDPDDTEQGKYTFTMPAVDVEITAAFKLKQYTVTYDLSGGNGADGVDYGPETVEAGTEITVKAAPKQDGHTFTGWFDGTTTHQPGWKITVTGNIKLTAQWDEVPKYTVTYELNGGTGAEGVDYTAQTVEAGTEITVKAAPGKDNYTFIGWSDGTTDYAAGDKITVNSDLTLYAKWEGDAPPLASPPVVDPPVVISGTASLTKVDADDDSTVLPGVVFELYRSTGRLVGTYTTNKNGEIRVSDLLEGDYYWKEVRSAEGYVLDDTEHSFTVSAWRTTSLVIENEKSGVPGVFTDDHYAYIVGSDGLVRPEANITRAEVATIFFRLLNEETRAAYLTDENTFTDVNEGDWFNTAASTMAAMGIVTGRPGGIFDPYANITRAEFAAITARFDANGDTTGASFTDIYGHWAEDEINIAANNGWILGSGGKFRPDDLITRAEAMTMVNRVLQRIPESEDDLHLNMILWPDNRDTSKWYYLMVQEATNSHDYVRKENGYECWISLRETPDWTALEQVSDDRR